MKNYKIKYDAYGQYVPIEYFYGTKSQAYREACRRLRFLDTQYDLVSIVSITELL